MKRALPLLAAPLLVAACSKGHRVYHVSVAPDEAQGVHYALPRAVLTVDLEIAASREIRGACYDQTKLRVDLGLAGGLMALIAAVTSRGKSAPLTDACCMIQS